MDRKNKLILYELSKNSRISNKKLSQKISLSQPSTLHRINVLEKDGILLNTHIIINNNALGLQGFRLYFSFFQTNPEKEKEIIQWLIEHPFTSIIANCSGDIDIAVIIWTKNIANYYEFYNEFKSKYGQFIHKNKQFTYIKTLFFSKSYLDNKNSEFLYSNDLCETQKHDELDKEILKTLNENSRTPYVEISKKTNSSIQTIIDRFKKMKSNKIITGFGANIDIRKLGFEYYKLSFTFNKRFSEKEIVGFCESIMGVVYVDITLGSYDLELNVEVESYKDVEKIIELVKEWANGISNFEFFQVKKYEKLKFI